MLLAVFAASAQLPLAAGALFPHNKLVPLKTIGTFLGPIRREFCASESTHAELMYFGPHQIYVAHADPINSLVNASRAFASPQKLDEEVQMDAIVTVTGSWASINLLLHIAPKVWVWLRF